MVSSRVKKSSLLSLALLGSLAAVINADEAPTLLRKRIESENKSLTEAKNEQRDLWDEVAAKAQFEDELDAYRDLQVMSMPSTPTMAPFQLPTLGPVICSGYSRENYLMQILSQVTDVNLLQNRLTPQGAAFHHMSKFDTYLQNPCNKDIPQRYGLLTLYFSTAGAQWTDNSGWTEEGNECNWIGVTCFQGVVTELDLEINNLDGEIPDEIRTLTGLEEVNLFANSLVGSIPSTFNYLSNLEKLDLQENKLTGMAFPFSIVSLDNLNSYKVSGNQLSDPIPPEVGNMKNLKELWASDNGIDGTLPTEIGFLRKLRTLALHENKIKGNLPSEMGLIPFEELYLHTNFLNEKLPSELFTVASLRELRLDGNFFIGDLPTQVGILTNLQDLRIDNNNLSGSIPSQLSRLTDLKYLKLAENFWKDSIPDVFGNYEALEFFDISGNEAITGNLPSSIFEIPTLKFVYMHQCLNLGGTIPNSFSDPSELRDLYLHTTKIGGTVPAVGNGKLLKLNEFLIQDTAIRGNMPNSVCALRSDGILDDLWSDCGGPTPEIQCSFPNCCNRCFEGIATTS